MKPFDESWLSAYLDHALTEEERLQVEQELAARPELVQELESLRDLRSRLAKLANPTFRIDLTAQVMQSIDTSSSPPPRSSLVTNPSAPEVPWLRRRSTWSMLATAACLVVLVSFMQWENGRLGKLAMQALPTNSPIMTAPGAPAPANPLATSDPADLPASESLGLESVVQEVQGLDDNSKPDNDFQTAPSPLASTQDESLSRSLAEAHEDSRRLAEQLDEGEIQQKLKREPLAEMAPLAQAETPQGGKGMGMPERGAKEGMGLQEEQGASSRFNHDLPQMKVGPPGGGGGMRGLRKDSEEKSDEVSSAGGKGGGRVGSPAASEFFFDASKVPADRVDSPANSGSKKSQLDSKGTLGYGGNARNEGAVSEPREVDGMMRLGTPQQPTQVDLDPSRHGAVGSMWIFVESSEALEQLAQHPLPALLSDRPTDAFLIRPVEPNEYSMLSLQPYRQFSRSLSARKNSDDQQPLTVDADWVERSEEEQVPLLAEAWILATPEQWETLRARLVEQGLIVLQSERTSVVSERRGRQASSATVGPSRPPRLVVPTPYGEAPCRWYKVTW